jgi:beta-aspartyl-peptidase (threonine type)
VRRTLRCLALALVAGAPACAHRHTPRAAAAHRAAIHRLLQAQAEAWNRGDLDGFLVPYEPSDALVFTSGAQIRRGFTQTRDRYRQRYLAHEGDEASPEHMGKLAFEVLDVRLIGTQGAVVLGRWELTHTPKAGHGVFTLVLERTAATWRIVHDHTSADPPP